MNSLALARSEKSSVKHDLCIGEPRFLENVYLPEKVRLEIDAARYPAFAGNRRLREKLGPPDLVTITNGAKSGLLAAVFAIKKLKQLEDSWEGRRLYVWAPRGHYWVGFEDIAELSGLELCPVRGILPMLSAKDGVTVVCSPNNPTGCAWSTEGLANSGVDIWDACYSSEIYNSTFKTIPYVPSKIAVYSAAKSFGVPGARVGWCLSANAEIANLVSEYVEKSTAGVSSAGQAVLEYCLDNPASSELVKKAKDTLVLNASLLKFALQKAFPGRPFSLEGFTVNAAGMFEVVGVPEEDVAVFEKTLEKASVRLLRMDKKTYRVNLGIPTDKFREAMYAIVEAAEHTKGDTRA